MNNAGLGFFDGVGEGLAAADDQPGVAVTGAASPETRNILVPKFAGGEISALENLAFLAGIVKNGPT